MKKEERKKQEYFPALFEMDIITPGSLSFSLLLHFFLVFFLKIMTPSRDLISNYIMQLTVKG